MRFLDYFRPSKSRRRAGTKSDKPTSDLRMGLLASHDQASSDDPFGPSGLQQVSSRDAHPRSTSSAVDQTPNGVGEELNIGTRGPSEAELILRGVRDSADAFGPLKSVAGTIYLISGIYERTEANKQSIELLALRVEALVGLLRSPVSEGDKGEESRRKILERKLEKVSGELEEFTKERKIEGLDKLGGLIEDVRDAMLEYQTLLQRDIYNKNCQLIKGTDLALLDRMYHAVDAGYPCGDRQGCMKGTRKEILYQIEKWSNDERDNRVFWLNGLAGTGKSTIAQTVAEASFASGKLGASVFCSRDFHDRSHLRSILPTLAFQLAHRYQRFREALLPVLVTSPDVGRGSLCSQMEKLIVGPFQVIQTPTVIVIDALDECHDKEPASALLSVLFRYVNKIPFVKFFITSRPEPQIRSRLRLELLRPETNVLRQHEIEHSPGDSDIQLFFKMRLADIARSKIDHDLSEGWPNSNDIDALCASAAGLFVYAATVVKYVASDGHFLARLLSNITSPVQNNSAEGQDGIDLLYSRILESVFEREIYGVGAENEKFLSKFKTAAGAVFLAFNPLSVEALSDLLGVSDASAALLPIRPFLAMNNGVDEIRVFHKSFPDFLTDPNRCTDQRFFVDPSVHHREILLLCLDLMKGRLKRNMCNLDDYAVLNDIKDLPDRRSACIGTALHYACTFWAKHLTKVPSGDSEVGEVKKSVDYFFNTNLLFWFEVLSLTRNLDVGIYAINDIRQWYISAGSPCKWADDSQRFLLEYFDIIRDSPPHIYHSALPLSPSSSWLRECYSAELSREVKVVAGLPTRWGTCSRTVSFDYTPLALAYWEDIVAVGSEYPEIVFLDAITGVQTGVLSEHTDWVRSLAFSNDGTLLVSGSDDKTVKLWDVQTGGVVKTFYGHSSSVSSVSVSPDLATVVSGSWDGTILLWHLLTGELHSVASHHDRKVTAINFSPTDPRTVISASESGDVRQWKVDGVQDGPSYGGFDVAYSPDGASFVSSAATIRSSETGAEILKLPTPDPTLIFQLCRFSPDGCFIACATGNNVFVWDISSPNPHLIENFVGHSKDITSLAFSSRLVSASRDRSIKFWQIGASQMDPNTFDTQSAPIIPVPIKFVSLQTESGIAISTDSAGMVKTWDLSTGLCEGSFKTQAKGRVDMQKINGRLVVVWYDWRIGEPGQVRVLDVEKGELLRTFGRCWSRALDLRISGDGSKVFLLNDQSIQAWSLSTGEAVGQAKFTERQPRGLIVNGSRVWLAGSNVATWGPADSKLRGWDFGIPGLPPAQFPDFLNTPRFHFVDRSGQNQKGSYSVKDTITGRLMFHLPKRFTELSSDANTRWDGMFLVVGLPSGGVLILNFSCVLPK